MANRWRKVEAVTDFISWAPKSLWMVTAAMKLKTLAPWKKIYNNLDSVLKSRDITLLTKVCRVKAMVFPVVMYGCHVCESLITKKAEHHRTDALKLWCWIRLLRVPWTARRSNQSVLKEINPEYSLEGLILKMKLQYFDHLMEELTHQKLPCCWERLKAGGEVGSRGWAG